MMAKRKARKHPRVVIQAPKAAARTWWRVRYVDADTGKTVRKTLDRALRTREQREDYACHLSDQLARRRLELESGAPRATGTPFEAAIQRYYDAHPNLRPRTVATYQLATNKLVRFAQQHRIRTVDDLDRRLLMQFREQIVNEPKQYNALEGKRGAKRSNGDPRSAFSANRELRPVGTCLRYLIDADLFSKLSHDDVRRCCKLLKATANRKQYLRPSQIQKLLAAALRHDADTYKATRTEHRGEAHAGTTRKYPPIAPFALYVLLTGCRLGEAIRAQWENVDLEDGSIHIGTESKTSQPRDVDIGPSPALGRLLAAQRLKSGGKGSVWGLTADEADAAMQRLRSTYGAPHFNYQLLRVSCQSFLASAPSIYGAASIFLAARRGGHSVAVCEKHYAGTVKGVSPEARTIESAMQIETQAAQVIASIAAPGRRGLVAV